ncbi:MAG: hypothetical protein SNI72_06085 [Rikenellaceae bacterium]
MTSCQDLPDRVDDGRIVASVGERMLRIGEVNSAIPSGVSGKDSVDFASLYVERWIARQVKLREAERIFSSSVSEIEAMVAEYRQALLMRKLDQYYINASKELPFNDLDIATYYKENKNSFKFERAMVKGLIIRLQRESEALKQIQTIMKSSNDESRFDLFTLCERSEGVDIEEYTKWMEYEDFISMLPIVRGRNSDQYLKRKGMQSLTDESHTYLFEITDYRNIGETAPLEIAEPNIRKILTSQHQKSLINERERALMKSAVRGNVITNNLNTTEDIEPK